MLNYTIPVIEQLADSPMLFNSDIVEQTQKRYELARTVTAYLQGNGNEEAFFYAVSQFLKITEYQRLLLYLPLSSLKNAPKWFREMYLDTWYELLNIQDARENFFEGDTFEMDARPDGQLERVVKCAHLTPWLVEAEYLGYSELRNILLLNQENEVLLRSFANTWRIIKDRGLLAEHEVCELEDLTAQVGQRAQLEPLYISEKRQKWLRERDSRTPEVLMTPNAKLAGPFSPNITPLWNELEMIQAGLQPEEIVLIGGSRLKGYGVEISDLDVFRLQDLTNNPVMKAGSPHAVHVYFNTLWLGGSGVTNLGEIAAKHAAAYFGRPDRAMALERLESDLLQYRLLHKGFSRFYGGYNSAAKGYAEMDGDCPFYDDKYRSLATELFAKYVFIPTIST